MSSSSLLRKSHIAGIPARLVQVQKVHPPRSIEVELILRDSKIVFYESHNTDGIKIITRMDERNLHARLLASDSLIFNDFQFQVRHSADNGLTLSPLTARKWTPPSPINVVTPTVTPSSKSKPKNPNMERVATLESKETFHSYSY
jgi:hypothetical protein